jgi:pimeloyl-ACP methyl ester carboxylesterase
MGKIVAACISIMALVLADVCADTKQENITLSQGSGPTIVIIGGANSTTEQLELLRGNFSGSVVIVPDKYYPLWLGADTVLRQIKDNGVKGKLVLIGHSWGGLLAREIDGEHPNLVKAVVTIATPCGNFRYTPEGVSNVALRPQDGNSKTPLYIIGGRKNVAQRWWMKTDDSDGVVDISSVMATGERTVKGSAILEGEHSELLQDLKVIGQIKQWLAEPDDKRTIAPAEVKANAFHLSNRKVALLRWSFMTGFFYITLLDLAQGTPDCDVVETCE